ncbi:hypothetical protein [Alteromonas gracilis]|uniref:hypothetical protein n=1 Tax=Alteromonas gracilis TaxID=1479524 RepID=UPI003734EFB5
MVKNIFSISRLVGILLSGCLALSAASPAYANENTDHFSVHFNPGAVMQLIAPITEAEKRALRDLYFKKNAQTAREHGYTQNGVLVVEKTLMGDFSPNVFVLSQWASLKAQRSFQELPLFTDVKSLRKEAWKALKLFDHEVKKPTTLTFSNDKTYSISLAWVNPKSPNEYYDFIDNLEQKVADVGGKLVSKTNNITLSDHNPNALAPQQIVILEWDDINEVETVFASTEFEASLKKLQKGTTDFELHLVRPRV